MLKRVKTSISNTQKQDVKDAVFYIFGKIFLNVFIPKTKALPNGEGFVLRKCIIKG